VHLSADDEPIRDVFDTTGHPRRGWMHALFDGLPLSEDVGRCVPGPPAPQRMDVRDGAEVVASYVLKTVGSWSNPADPIAVYGASPIRARPQDDERR
jgi:hypothetical protein